MKRRLIAGTINRYAAEDGWENVHLDASDRPLPDGSPPEIVLNLTELCALAPEEFDEVRCWQTLEHLWPRQAELAAIGFRHVLRPGGILDVEVPDFERIAKAWAEGRYSRRDLLRVVYGDDAGMADDHLNAHRHGYWEGSLRDLLAGAGFDVGGRLDDDESLQLRFRAARP